MRLMEKNILITGANRGMGLAFAKELAQKKAHLHILSRTFESSLKNELLTLGAMSVQHWPVNLESSREIDDFLERWNQSKDAADILVNNAGQLTGGLLEEQDLNSIYRMLQVNLLAAIHLTRGLLPGMIQRKRGLIVNNASVAGRMMFPCASTYAASKAGIIAFTKCLQAELEGSGVRALTLLTPGVKTDMYDQIPDLYGGHLNLRFLSPITAGRWANQVVSSMEGDDLDCLPKGVSGLGLRLAQHFPNLFARIVSKQFKR